MGKITPKQGRFVQEYLVDLNATQAAIRAGYSEKRASEIGYQLLQKTTVSNAIEASMKEREKRTEITQDMIVQQLAKIAFTDIRDTVEWDETGIRMKPSDQVDGTIIAGVSQTEIKGIISTEVKMNDRMRALEMLGRHLGMFKENINIKGQLGVTIVDDIDD